MIGTTALFNVAAAGTPPLFYQWRKDGAPLAGATNATLILPSVQLGAMTNYAVVVTNYYGSVTSAVARLTVNTAPAAGGTAFQSVQPQFAYVGYVNGEVGFKFRPAANLTITNLGYAFEPDHLPAAYVVLIRNSAGSILASATLKTSSGPSSQFIYTNIPALNPPAGSTNFLACYDANEFATNEIKFWTGTIIDATAQDTGVFVASPELDYLGATVNGNLASGNLSPFVLFVGPSFQYAATAAVTITPSWLNISLTDSNTVLLAWPSADNLGQLQSASSLTSTMTNVLNSPVLIGTNRIVELPAVEGQRLFRLVYP